MTTETARDQRTHPTETPPTAGGAHAKKLTAQELRQAIRTTAALLTGNGPDRGMSNMRKHELQAYLDAYLTRLEAARAVDGAYEQEAAKRGWVYDDATNTWVDAPAPSASTAVADSTPVSQADESLPWIPILEDPATWTREMRHRAPAQYEHIVACWNKRLSVWPMGGPRQPQLNGRLVIDTYVPCPACAAAGYLTTGRYTPTLKRLRDDQRGQNEPDAPFCEGAHGYDLIVRKPGGDPGRCVHEYPLGFHCHEEQPTVGEIRMCQCSGSYLERTGKHREACGFYSTTTTTTTTVITSVPLCNCRRSYLERNRRHSPRCNLKPGESA